MKKQVLTAIISMIPVMSFAKISDFNELISENTRAQSELHSNVKNNIEEARALVAAEDVPSRKRIVVIENTAGSYNAPTSKDLLKFEKEKRRNKASEGEHIERFAAEMSSLGY